MQVAASPSIHLAYCQNIHPGETWQDHYAALRDKAVAVKKALKTEAPFGLGLRISAHAARELGNPELIQQGRELFAQHHLYPFSINGFPFGKFHKGPVKENVYAPDWRSSDRLEYTNQLAHALAQWLPEGQDGSISTVPGSFAPWIQTDADRMAMATGLGSAAAEMAKLERETGKYIHLGLEPEPDCFLETTQQTLTFFAQTLPAGAVAEIRRQLTVSDSEAERLLRRHIGVCFDTCHVALQYEDLATSLSAYQKAGILISKIQLSAALRAPGGAPTYEALRAFAEPTYLHQVKALTRNGERLAWSDLPLALKEMLHHSDIEELRVHFHVPLFIAPKAPLESTSNALDEAFWHLVRTGVSSHLEIETYTFDVLPPEVHPGDIIQSIVSEYRWVLTQMSQTQF